MTITTHTTPDTGVTTALPTNLGEHRAAVLALRKVQTQHDRAAEAARKSGEMLEAGKSELSNLQNQRIAELLAAFGKGKDGLTDAQQRAFMEKERQIASLVHELPVAEDELPDLRAQLEANAAVVARQWAALWLHGRALALPHLEDLVSDARNRLDDPQGQVFEIGPKLELIRDACAAHQAFRNAAAGIRQVVGIEFWQAHPTVVANEGMRRGDPDMLASRIDLPGILRKWVPIVPEVKPEPDETKVAALVLDLQRNFFVMPYTTRERELERIAHVGPAETHMIKAFRANEGENMREHERHAMERRIAEIDAAERELQAIRSQPH